jgi:hypothetical protein
MPERDPFFMRYFCCTLHYFNGSSPGFLLLEALAGLALVMVSVGMVMNYYGHQAVTIHHTQKKIEQFYTVIQYCEDLILQAKPFVSQATMITKEFYVMPIQVLHAAFPVRPVMSFSWIALGLEWSSGDRMGKRVLITGYNEQGA